LRNAGNGLRFGISEVVNNNKRFARVENLDTAVDPNRSWAFHQEDGYLWLESKLFVMLNARPDQLMRGVAYSLKLTGIERGTFWMRRDERLQTWPMAVTHFSKRSGEGKPKSSLAPTQTSPRCSAGKTSEFEGKQIDVLNQTKIEFIDRKTFNANLRESAVFQLIIPFWGEWIGVIGRDLNAQCDRTR
jgi:hypothetical protein